MSKMNSKDKLDEMARCMHEALSVLNERIARVEAYMLALEKSRLEASNEPEEVVGAGLIRC